MSRKTEPPKRAQRTPSSAQPVLIAHVGHAQQSAAQSRGRSGIHPKSVVFALREPLETKGPGPVPEPNQRRRRTTLGVRSTPALSNPDRNRSTQAALEPDGHKARTALPAAHRRRETGTDPEATARGTSTSPPSERPYDRRTSRPRGRTSSNPPRSPDNRSASSRRIDSEATPESPAQATRPPDPLSDPPATTPSRDKGCKGRSGTRAARQRTPNPSD